MRRLALSREIDSGGDHLEFEFPALAGSGGAEPLPRAFLSLRSAGSMRYLRGQSNPIRLGFFTRLGARSVVSTELHHTRRVRVLTEAAGGEGGSAPRARELDAGDLPGLDLGNGGPDRAEGRDGILLPGRGEVATFGASVTVADCLPIWLFDRETGARAILHSGWKGTGILEVAVRALVDELGSKAASIAAIFGPAIGACCYEVPEERARNFELEFGSASVDRSGRKPRLDLRAANLALAHRLGLGAVLDVDICTACSERLGSFRREGSSAFTRMVALSLPAATRP